MKEQPYNAVPVRVPVKESGVRDEVFDLKFRFGVAKTKRELSKMAKSGSEAKGEEEGPASRLTDPLLRWTR